jgi:hypothetical protein
LGRARTGVMVSKRRALKLSLTTKYENDSIVVDGKSFRKCSFKNVTFRFHGAAPFEFMGETTLDSGSVRFVTDDPAILLYSQMTRKFEAIASRNAKVETGALDAKGREVPLQLPTVRADIENCPQILISKIECDVRGMFPETKLTLQNANKREGAQKVRIKDIHLSNGTAKFREIPLMSADATITVVAEISRPDRNVFRKRDLLDLIRTHCLNENPRTFLKEYTLPAAITFEDLAGNLFETAFELVFHSLAYTAREIAQSERVRNEQIVLEARHLAFSKLPKQPSGQ